MPLGGQHPTFLLQHPHRAPRLCGDSLCHSKWLGLPGSRLGPLLFTPVRFSQYLFCSSPGLLGRPCSLLWQGCCAKGGGSGDKRRWRPRGGETDSFSHLPPRSATGWWKGSCSTIAAWQRCVAVPPAGTACAWCSLPMLAAVPRRVPHLPGGTRPSAVSRLSQPTSPQSPPPS